MSRESSANCLPIVFICDENYAMPTAVAISTLQLSKKRDSRYAVYVLGVDLSSDSRQRIASLDRPDCSVTVMDRSLSAQQADIPLSRERVTPAALLKFDLPLIFEDRDKLLYLDSDMLIQKDLSALFATDIQGVYAAVVQDIITINEMHRHYLDSIGFHGQLYFNSGMLLLNLKKMREDHIPEKLLDYRLNGKNHFMDQDALNVILADRVRCVSPYYNLLSCFFDWQSIPELAAFYAEDFPLCKELVFENAAILHFGDVRKPWRHEMGFLSALYKACHQLSPYADQPLPIEGDVFLGKLAFAEFALAEARRREAEALDEALRQKQKQEALRHSFSYRVGWFITWLPRKLWRLVFPLTKER